MSAPNLLLIEKRFTLEELTLIFDGQSCCLTQAKIDYETSYDRVSCVAYQHLTRYGVCQPNSTGDTKYTPLAYEPSMLWRRCDECRASAV